MTERTSEGQFNDDPRGNAPEDYRGDAGDQANDLRFREEQDLIRDQSGAEEDVVVEPVGTYTDSEIPEEPQETLTTQIFGEEGEYTDSDVPGSARGTDIDGEYPDIDGR